MAEQPARILAPFARVTREALESVAAAPIATSLLFRAVAASTFHAVPEDPADFRVFIDGPLRVELQRSLGPGAVTLVLGRLSQALAAANSESSASQLARDWSRSSRPPIGSGGVHGSAHQSGSHPVVRRRAEPIEDGHEKRPTMPAPSTDSDRARRSPLPVRPAGAPVELAPRRLRPPAATVRTMERVTGGALTSCVLVVSLDPMLATDTATEIAGRCAVLVIHTPADLARAASRVGERFVVLLDAAMPAIDPPTFVGLAPILPADTRIVLWGADERTLQRLSSQFPAARTWSTSGDSTTPGTFALSLP